MFLDIFSFKPKKVLGIDIGTTCIRIVELSRRGQNKRLENYGELGIDRTGNKPFRVFERDTLLLSDQDVAEAIRVICQEAGMQPKEAIFSIPDFCSFFTSFELPVMDKEEVNEAIKYEVRPYIPLPFSEITLDWVVTEGEPGKTPLKILAAAVPNDVVGQYQEIARLSNLSLKLLEPEVFALARSSVKKEDEKKIIALLDIGARSTTCSILEKGVLKVSHSFNIAGNELTQILAKSLNIEYNKAEAIKKKYGLNSEAQDGEIKKNTKEILSPIIDSILEEIKKMLRDFYKSKGEEVEKLLLAGGLASLPGLKDYFANDLKKEVEIVNSFWKVSYPPILEEVLKNKAPSYAVAVGLALKGFE